MAYEYFINSLDPSQLLIGERCSTLFPWFRKCDKTDNEAFGLKASRSKIGRYYLDTSESFSMDAVNEIWDADDPSVPCWKNCKNNTETNLNNDNSSSTSSKTTNITVLISTNATNSSS